MTNVSLIQACEDHELLGLTLWPFQRQMASALDDGAGLVVAALGRRGGKTTAAAAVLVHDALLRPALDTLVQPGEIRYAVVVATRLPQAQAVLSMARAMVERSPVLSAYLVSATADTLLFERPGGHRTAILALPCSSRAGRGLAISCVVCDEFAHFQTDSEGPATAERVWASIVPGTAQFGPLGRVVVISSPLGDENLFAQLHRDALAGDIERAVALQAATLEANPTVSAAWIEAQRRVMSPAEFEAEYEARFTVASGGFLDLTRIQRSVSDPSAVDDCVVGLDPGQRDGFGLVVVGAALDPPARLCVVHVAKLDARVLTGAVDEAATIAHRFSARVVTDQFSGAMTAERLRGRGVSVSVRPWAASSGPVSTGKFEAYADLRTRLYGGELELLDDPELRTELGGLQLRASGGAWRVTSPRRAGSHGDLASALALAVAHCHEPQERLAWLSDEDRAAREREEAMAAYDRAMAVERTRLRWDLPKSWSGGSVMGDVMNQRF